MCVYDEGCTPRHYRYVAVIELLNEICSLLLLYMGLGD